MQKNYQNIYNDYLQKLSELNKEEERQMSNMAILSWEVQERAKEQIAETFRLKRKELETSSPYKEAIIYRQQMIDSWEAYLEALRKIDINQLHDEESDVKQKLTMTEQEYGGIQARLERDRKQYEIAKAAYEETERLSRSTQSSLNNLRQELHDVTEKERRYNEEVNNTYGMYIAALEDYWISIIEAVSADDIKDLIIPEITARLDNEEEFVKMYDSLVKRLFRKWWIVPASLKDLKKAILGDPNWSFDELMDAIYWERIETEPENNEVQAVDEISEWNRSALINSENVDNVPSEWKMGEKDVVKYLSELNKSSFIVKYVNKLKKIRWRYSWAYHLLLNVNDREPVKLLTQLVNLYKNPKQALDTIIRAPLSTNQMDTFLKKACSSLSERSEDNINSALDWFNNNIKPWECGRFGMQSTFLQAFNMRSEEVGSDDCPKFGYAKWWDCSWNWKSRKVRKYYKK